MVIASVSLHHCLFILSNSNGNTIILQEDDFVGVVIGDVCTNF